MAVSQVSLREFENCDYTRIAGPGVVYLESEEKPICGKKRRRTREEGVEGGEQFQDWGARKLLILAIVSKVQENAYNLDTIFNAINLNQLQFKLTGDFSFFMPCLGLLKGCGSCNPCPLCDQERSKEGGQGAQ